jgi:hypothetical protein
MITLQRDVYLPDVITLDYLERLPVKYTVPICGGIDVGEEIFIDFRLKCKRWGVVGFRFEGVCDQIYFCDILFGFKGMRKGDQELYLKKFEQRGKAAKISVLEQAVAILKGYEFLKVYKEAIEERLDLYKNEED